MAIESDLIRTVYKATFGAKAPHGHARERLSLQVPGVALSAWITSDMRLDLEVEVTGWDTEVERALYDQLDHSQSPVAGLLLWEWSELRRTCAAALRRSA